MVFSRFIKEMPLGEGQYEGFGYLGLGVIFLFLITTFKYIICQPKINLFIRPYIPLFLVVFFFTIFSFSNQVYWSEQEIITYNIPHKLLKIFSVFRASGRFIWPIHYLILFSIVIFTFKVWKSKQLYFILPVIILFQFLDFTPKYFFIQQKT